MSVKQEIMALPNTVVLDTTAAVGKFRKAMESLHWFHDVTVEARLDQLFSYLFDKVHSRESVLDYMSDVEEEYKEQNVPASAMTDLLEACETVAEAIWHELVLWNIFSKSGTNWYYMLELIGDDMVIKKQDEEIIDECEIDDQDDDD